MPASSMPSKGLLEPAGKKTERKIKRSGAHPKRQYVFDLFVNAHDGGLMKLEKVRDVLAIHFCGSFLRSNNVAEYFEAGSE